MRVHWLTDSYEQDISARSPVYVHDAPRQSLDSARFPRMPRSSIRDRPFDRQPPTAEEGFEDVGLNDEQKQLSQLSQQPKKRGFFSKFSDSQEPSNHSHMQGMSRFIPGRKRAQSGQGAVSAFGLLPPCLSWFCPERMMIRPSHQPLPRKREQVLTPGVTGTR